jgi:hypothetical protein
MGGSTLQPIQMKATYKMSAIGNQTFVVSLEQCQPVSIFMAEDNIQPFYQVFATQIKYVYTSNNLTRWCPTHLGVLVAGTAFTNLNCCITQCIRSTVATNHVV